MEVIIGDAPCPHPEEGVAATIGFFDGVHRGHRRLIDAARTAADNLGSRTAVVTFDRHPASVVRPESAPLLLTDLDQRLERLDNAGVDVTLVVNFDEARAKESAEDFVTEVLVGCLAARAVVVGADFHFGHQRRGNVSLLAAMGAEHGFEVRGIDLAGMVDLDGNSSSTPISSTAIRTALAAGDVVSAAAMLGHPHEVRGVVERGDRRGGSQLGYPTANLAVPAGIQLPTAGIYAGWYVRPDGQRHPAAIPLGWHPTLAPTITAPRLEAHLLDFEGDLYGEEARVQFVARVRDEVRFETVKDLVAQISDDVTASRELLGV
ncbi:bifunctional riboflavin kinase/FAD synthetase [soil metagenome]